MDALTIGGLVVLALCPVGVAAAVLGIRAERRLARIRDEAAAEVATFVVIPPEPKTEPVCVVLVPALEES